MKTWEMIKELTENPEKKFKLVGFGGDGETNIVKLNKKTNVIAWDGDEFLPLIVRKSDSNEWEEVKEPVSFMEAAEEVKMNNTRIKVKHELYTSSFMMLIDLLDVIVNEVGCELGSRVVAKILTEGKFYIED